MSLLGVDPRLVAGLPRRRAPRRRARRAARVRARLRGSRTSVAADELRDVLPEAALSAVRATVAQIEVSNLVGNTVDGMLARLTRKRPMAPVAFARGAA